MAKKNATLQNNNLQLRGVDPLNRNQELAFDSDKHLLLHGVAGTGKTFISFYFAFRDLLDPIDYDKVVVIRSAVPTRDIGFLPGSVSEKVSVYEEPYKDIANYLLCRGDAYDLIKQKGILHFMTTSFIRGMTLRDAIVIVDECQNMSFHELDSIITRMGDSCRFILCGDFRQSDLKSNGLSDFVRIIKAMDIEGEPAFDFVDFGVDDIVRGPLVASYIKTKDELGL